MAKDVNAIEELLKLKCLQITADPSNMDMVSGFAAARALRDISAKRYAPIRSSLCNGAGRQGVDSNSNHERCHVKRTARDDPSGVYEKENAAAISYGETEAINRAYTPDSDKSGKGNC